MQRGSPLRRFDARNATPNLNLLSGQQQCSPQDDTASFAQPGELLVETERTIGDLPLHALHLHLTPAVFILVSK